jgi:hypothetical protein
MLVYQRVSLSPQKISSSQVYPNIPSRHNFVEIGISSWAKSIIDAAQPTFGLRTLISLPPGNLMFGPPSVMVWSNT